VARSFKVLDGYQVAQEVADRLQPIYGSRLRKVVLYGSWARGEADPEESDVDLLVIVDRVEDGKDWDRVGRVADVLAVEAGRPVMTFPVAESDLAAPGKPVLMEALKEGLDFYPADDRASA
jgi:predicted nucleotidyltransferase